MRRERGEGKRGEDRESIRQWGLELDEGILGFVVQCTYYSVQCAV